TRRDVLERGLVEASLGEHVEGGGQDRSAAVRGGHSPAERLCARRHGPTLLTDSSVSYSPPRCESKPGGGGDDGRRERAHERGGGDQLRRPLPAVGGGELEGDRDRPLRGPKGLGGAQRDSEEVGAVDLLDVLL